MEQPISFMERSTFLRVFNFLRIQHPYRVRYLVWFPLFLGVVLSAPFITSSSFSFTDYFKNHLQILILLFPFFIASLAAVATFDGGKAFDDEIEMPNKVIIYLNHRGANTAISVTSRYYMSLLFAYVSAISIMVIFCLLFESGVPVSPLMGDMVFELFILKIIFSLLFNFIFSQIMVLLFISVYFLGDHIHRKSLLN